MYGSSKVRADFIVREMPEASTNFESTYPERIYLSGKDFASEIYLGFTTFILNIYPSL